MSAPRLSPCRVAIVGASSLRGSELKLVLEESNFPAAEVILLDESIAVGTLTEAAGEPTFIRAIEADEFEGVRFAFFAGTPKEARKNWPEAQRAGATVIDLTGALAAVPEAIQWISSLGEPLPEKSPGRAPLYRAPSAPVIIACVLATALAPLAPARTALVFFPPVSQRDRAGVDELESQTASLLSFREISKTVFDTQVAFNLLSEYGEGSRPSLAEIRGEIARDVATYLAQRIFVPAIQLVHAPVFYGYAFAGFAEFALSCAPEQIEEALTRAGIKFAAAGDPGPNNVSIAGQSDIVMGPIEPDANVTGGYWFWGAADNLRLAAANAVRIAEHLLSA